MKTTIKQNEINNFKKDSQHWWDETGPFAPLHALNPVRLRFMRDTMDNHLLPASSTVIPAPPTVIPAQAGIRHQKRSPLPLANLTHLDIGCGGGLICEPFARLGATVTGLDADDQAITAARAHAKQMNLSISYAAQSIEQYRKNNQGASFDIITALEIIEHVAAPELFLDETVKLLKPGGILFVSTLNRTAKSFALGIVAAEYILGWVPRGTHNWRQFIAPSTLNRTLSSLGLAPVAASGLCYHPMRRDFYLDPHDLSVNYIMAFVKRA